MKAVELAKFVRACIGCAPVGAGSDYRVRLGAIPLREAEIVAEALDLLADQQQQELNDKHEADDTAGILAPESLDDTGLISGGY